MGHDFSVFPSIQCPRAMSHGQTAQPLSPVTYPSLTERAYRDVELTGR